MFDAVTSGRCSICGFLLNRNIVPPEFSLSTPRGGWIEDESGECRPGKANSKRQFAYSTTYDGGTIVSDTFRTILEANVSTTVEFVEIPREERFFLLRPCDAVALDEGRGATVREHLCAGCKQYESCVGPSDYLAPWAVVDELGMYRSTVEFGSGDEKCPLVIVGPALRARLKEARLKRLTFRLLYK